MAGDKSKKRAEKNTARLKLLFRVVAGSVLFHVLLRLVWKGSTASAWIHYPLFATAATSAWFCRHGPCMASVRKLTMEVRTGTSALFL